MEFVCERLIRHRIIIAAFCLLLFFGGIPFFFLFFFVSFPHRQKTLFGNPLQHSKTFGVSDGLEESLFQFVLGGVFREQQGVEAGVGGW